MAICATDHLVFVLSKSTEYPAAAVVCRHGQSYCSVAMIPSLLTNGLVGIHTFLTLALDGPVLSFAP